MAAFVVTRLLIAVVQIFFVAVLVFTLTTLLPGNTAVVILGEHATAEQVTALRAQLALDRPPLERFVEWGFGLLHGDLGTSLLTGTPVIEDITQGVATTAVLTGCTLAVVIPLALTIGIYSGLRPASPADRVLNGLIVMLDAIPEFAFALVLIGAFALRLGWFPATAAGASGELEPAVLVLPVVVLTAKPLCALARQVRIGVVEADNAEYTTHVRLHGLAERFVLLRHVLPNALGASVQQLARCVDGLLGGVVVVEAVFALPGVGAGFLDAVMARDIPAIQAYAVMFVTVTVSLNLLADVVGRKLVPQRKEVT